MGAVLLVQNTDIYLSLLNLIREYAKTRDRLPPEDVLAAQVGVSRVKLRDVLAELQSNGYISRKKGVGTLINKYMLCETARLDTNVFLEELIADSGHRPMTLLQKVKLLPNLPEPVCSKLDAAPDESAYLIEKTVFADEIPMIFVTDYVPSRYFDETDMDLRLLASSTFSFVGNCSNEQLDNLIVHLEAVGADAHVADSLRLPQGTPLLRLTSVCYSQRLIPIVFSIEHYNSSLIPLAFQKRVIRSKYNAAAHTR